MILTINNTTFTPGSPGGLIPLGTPLGPGASTVPVIVSIGVGLNSVGQFGAIQIIATGGPAVCATNGVILNLYSSADGVNFDTIPMSSTYLHIPVGSGATSRQTVKVEQGIYQLVLQNVDTVNG